MCFRFVELCGVFETEAYIRGAFKLVKVRICLVKGNFQTAVR